MIPITPEQSKFIVPEGGVRSLTYLGPASRPEVLPLETLVTADGRVVSQWQPTAGELELLKLGVPVTLVLHSGGVVPPIQLGVGGFDLR